jgi:hypothetical protein
MMYMVEINKAFCLTNFFQQNNICPRIAFVT